MKYTLLVLGLLLTTACAPRYALEPLCDREAQEWNKFETQEDNCARTSELATPTPTTPLGGKPRTPPVPKHDDPVPTPPDDTPPNPDPDPPVDPEDPEDDPNKGPKGNNGHGNGDQDAPGNSCEHNNAENADCEDD